MCQDWNQEYAECQHVYRKLINCPTYYKQQGLSKGLIGRLFHSGFRNKKDCGRVIPHFADIKPFCPNCTVKNDKLRARCVGDGALRVYRPTLEDDSRGHFEEHREKRKQAGAGSHERPQRYVRHVGPKHNKTTSDVKPGVWIPELYHHPQSLAGRELYNQAAGAAPPVDTSRVNSSPSSKRPLGKSGKPKTKSQAGRSFRERIQYRDTNGTSVFDNSQAPQKPAEPAPAHHHPRHRQPQQMYVPRRTPPLRRLDASKSVIGEDYPILRRQHGQVFDIHPLKQPDILHVPLPEYQVYLNGLRFAEKNSKSDTKIAKMPRLSPKNKNRKYSKEQKRLSTLRKAIGMSSSPDSEVSFVCRDSKKLASS
ncbi:hypothetical protein GGR54DRAFT_86139 [Hypoxylon sp. NC1633]|nr:hypothetical protein GGR54DRAFT_86139 [Hypoxylon sp. NC1633]